MNEILRDKLSIIVSDKLLIQALRAVFDERVQREYPEIREGQDDTLLGQKYRAYQEAKKIVDNAFTDLAGYEVGKKAGKSFNKER